MTSLPTLESEMMAEFDKYWQLASAEDGETVDPYYATKAKSFLLASIRRAREEGFNDKMATLGNLTAQKILEKGRKEGEKRGIERCVEVVDKKYGVWVENETALRAEILAELSSLKSGE